MSTDRLYCHTCGNSFRKNKYHHCPRCRVPLWAERKKLSHTTTKEKLVQVMGKEKIFLVPSSEEDTLVIYHNDDVFAIYHIGDLDEVIIGRSLSAHIWLAVETVSKKHARIFRSSEGWTVQDLGSRNGTFLNERPLSASDSPILRDGDIVRISDFYILCHFPQKISEAQQDSALSPSPNQTSSPSPPPLPPSTAGAVKAPSPSLSAQVDQDVTFLAFQNHSKLQEKLEEAARIVQQYLKPVPSNLGRAKIAHIYHPLVHIGGDFYFVSPITEKKAVIALGDVTGHGIAAALLMVGCLPILEHEATQTNLPSQVLTRVNQMILPRLQKDKFITCFLCFLDLETGELTYTSAGHPPPLLCRANGEIRSVPGKGPALGLSSQPTYQDYSLQLLSGDRLFLFTDGILEAEKGQLAKEKLVAQIRQHIEEWQSWDWSEWLKAMKKLVWDWEEKSMFGLRRVSEFLQKMRHLPPQKCLDALFDTLKQFTAGSHLQDDVTMIVVDWE